MIDETTHWQTTKALSVYNVLVVNKTNAAPLTVILAALQRNHLPRYDAEDVTRGVDFLVQRGFVRVENDVLFVAHSAGPHKPVRLKRIDGDTDLALDL